MEYVEDEPEDVQKPGYWPFTEFNRNVSASFWMLGCFVTTVPFSGGTLTTILIFMIMKGSTALSGYGMAVRSLARLLVTLPVAVWTDKSERKETIMRIGSMITLLRIVFSVFAILWTFRDAGPEALSSTEPLANACYACFYLFLLSRAIAGIAGCFTTTPEAAIVGNSTRLGDRTRISGTQQMISGGGEIIGQLLLALLFWYQGNRWTLGLVGTTMVCGELMQVSVAYWMCFFEDRYMYKDGGGTLKLTAAVADGPTSEKAPPPKTAVDDKGEEEEGQGEGQGEGPGEGPTWYGWLLRRQVPFRMNLANLLWLIGDGLTSPFWSLLFMNKYGLSPLLVLLIQLIAPASELGGAFVGMALAKMLGRVETMLLGGSTVALSMAAMGALLASSYSDNLSLMIALFSLRCVAMSVVFPAMGSLFMDTIPPKERARWESLSTIHQVNFSATAMLGGYIIEVYGYGATFYVTALLNVVGVFIMSTIMPLVPRFEADAAKEEPSKLV